MQNSAPSRAKTAIGPNRAAAPAVYTLVTDVAVGWAARADARPDACSDAFTAFYTETIGRLGGYAFQLVGDPEVAADIVQEAYTRLLSRWVGIRKPRPYVFHVVTNLARDAWSTRQRADLLVRGIVDTRPALAAPAVDPSVWDAVERLPAKHREVVLLFYYADLPVNDVAAAVRRPTGTVKRLLSEARDLLAESLGDVR